ncbi:hypothetical protein GCM10011514_16850 [Emticicia aquatilis]|uniref:Uncharacterized protein n=1 Tax=Emticicia aquatilis TaxID=1537369 RepID=A0A916YNM3_9BACT|nr:hypothetical protein [Emticicia aquatilis]GGD53359.1 hypothetical protein GCM10011514_16850 [Emticicia aquatilis]
MATKAEKYQWNQLPEPWRHGGLFRNINNDLSVARQVGFVWSESANTWYIEVDGTKYWAYDTSISYEAWADPYRNLGDKNPNNDAIFVWNNTGKAYQPQGTYVLRQDENGLWFYYDDLGKKIYDDATYSNDVKAQDFIGNSILNAPTYDAWDANIKDILGNPIVPKKPEVGLYDTKNYLDSVDKKRTVYKQFYSAKTQTEKLNAISVRAADIVAEQNQLISDLNKAGAAIKRENIIINTVVGGFGSASIKAASTVTKLNPIGVGLVVFGYVKKYAASKTTGRREQLRSEDLLYLEEELNAIKAYIEKNNLSSDSGNADKKTIYWIIGSVVVLGIVIYFLVRNK